MERLGLGVLRPGVKTRAGYRAAAAGVCAAMLLGGCSVTVQPKHPAAVATPPKPTGATTPSTAPSSTASKPAPKDVDHTVCLAVRGDLSSAQQKVGGADKSSPRKMGADFKAAGDSLRSESQKTKDTGLKATLTQLATDYDTLGADVAAKRSTDADLKKIADIGPKLDELCPQKS